MKYSIGVIAFTFLSILLCVLYSSDDIYCVVKSAGQSKANGYYVAEDGFYFRHGQQHLTAMPDVFDYFNEKYAATTSSTLSLILFTKGYWVISTIDGKGKSEPLYENDCAKAVDTATCVQYPPSEGWEIASSSSSKLPLPVVSSQRGNLVDSFSTGSKSKSNLSKLWDQPITTIILIIIFIVAYILWAYRIDVGAISYSYDAVVNRGEYWRIVTASLSHVDALHLLFNAMTLYQLGSVESVYGSLTYAYLSFALIFLTILICIGIDYILIYRYNRTEQQHAQAIGYSCVLFAWMVAVSVRMPKFCPIFIFPSLCVSTWTIPYPAFLKAWTGIAGLPINLGPFLLLFITKLIIPRSSFFGHLAGIIIGYPLAWNMLDFLTLPWTCAILMVIWLVQRKQWLWTFPSVEMSFASLSEFLSTSTLALFYGFVLFSVVVSVLYSVLLFWVSWWEQGFPRFVGIFMLICGIWAKKIEFHAFSTTVQQDASRFLWFTWLFLSVFWWYDLWNTIVYYRGAAYFAGNGISESSLQLIQLLSLLTFFSTTLYLLLLLRLLQLAPTMQEQLSFFRWDSGSMWQDWLPVYDRCCKPATIAFSGRSFRPTNNTTGGTNHNGNNNNNNSSIDDSAVTVNPLTGRDRGRDGGASAQTKTNGIAMTHMTRNQNNTGNASTAGNGHYHRHQMNEDEEEGQLIGSGRGYDPLPQLETTETALISTAEKKKQAQQISI